MLFRSPQKNFPIQSLVLGASYTSKKLSEGVCPIRNSSACWFFIHTMLLGSAVLVAFLHPNSIANAIKRVGNTRPDLKGNMKCSKIVHLITQPHKVWFGTTEKMCIFVLLCCTRCSVFDITFCLAFSPSGCRFLI